MDDYFDNVVDRFIKETKPQPRLKMVPVTERNVRIADMTVTERTLHDDKVATRTHLKLVPDGN